MKKCLSGNALKLLGCAFMLLDHLGVILFPSVLVLRYFGRLAFPIFAFLIAEGAYYTRHRVRYLLRLFLLGLLCQAVMLTFVGGEVHLNIFLTFAFSVALIYLMSFCLRLIADGAFPPPLRYALPLLLLGAALLAVGALTHLVHFDYGFFGVMTPVLVSLPAALGREGRSRFFAERLCMLTLALALLSLALGLYEYLCLLAVPLIALYSGKRGRYRLKYFFYAFYPVHLALLYGIRMLLL